MTTKKFVQALELEVVIDQYHLDFSGEEFGGYYLCSSSANYIIANIVPRTFISHESALNVWAMVPPGNRIFINREQSPSSGKAAKGTLVQSAIDTAFSKPQREPGAPAEFNGIDVFLIRGKFTDQLGVTEVTLKDRENVMVTDLERTLIDCVVRPGYAPDPEEMVDIFRRAKADISVTLLADYLKKLNYTYPYHQCIGFYMERAQNYSADEIDLFFRQEIKYDFYLDYDIHEPVYDARWKLYYPQVLDLKK
ncbi:hypothetical protein [Mucilaginibacter celer]|nr:hypothetical protein [Mucilaginibacter celer]